MFMKTLTQSKSDSGTRIWDLKHLAAFCLLTLLSISAMAQSLGTITGTVSDKGSGAPSVKVIAFNNGQLITGVMTDLDGNYKLAMLPPGTYSLEIRLLDTTVTVNGIVLSSGEARPYDVRVREYVIGGTKIFGEAGGNAPPLFVVDPIQPITYTSSTIKQSGLRNTTDIAGLSPKMVQADQGSALNFAGSRSNATQYIVDGVKMIGEVGLPLEAIDQITVISGGLPAEYGDCTGGVIMVTTHNPGMKAFVGSPQVKKEKTKKVKKSSQIMEILPETAAG